MSSFPFISLFSFTLILGSLLALSGSHWIFVWMGLELNLLSFIPLLTASNNNQEAEAAMKYFMAQALGSGLILLGSLSLYSLPHMLLPPFIFKGLIFIGLLTKLGLPPCHFWFPSVMSLISWPMCIILATWQKLVPIFIIMYLFSLSFSPFISFIICLGALIGGLGGINQSQLRPLLAYSSIGHMSWILAASMVSCSSALIYLISYIVISLSLMLTLWNMNVLFSSSLNKMSSFNSLNSFSISALLLSLGGIPPFLGFFPKWLVMESLVVYSPILTFIIIMGSLINLLYYLNLVFINFLKAPVSFIFKPTSSSNPLLLILGTSTLGLGPIAFCLIYAMIIFY